MHPPSPADFAECAEAAARAAGTHALKEGLRRREVAESFEHDVKLVLDQECQDIALATIQERFPGHAILAEEDPASGQSSDGYRWIVDPIDGTVNFTHAHDFWCCSVALQENGRTIAACVFAPALDFCFTAHSGGGAFCNGTRLQVSETDTLATAMVHTGMDRELIPGMPRLTMLTKLSERCRKIRVVGSAALDLCYVAMGRADGYFEGGIYLWDVAAAGLIIREAGGKAEILGPVAESHRLCFVASNGLVHQELTTLVNEELDFETSPI